MMRRGLLIVTLAALTLSPHLAAQNQTLEVTRLADGVFAAVYSEFRMDPIEGNSLIVIGSDGVLVLDSGRTPDAARTLMAEIRKRTDRPVRYVVNSHWHDDHVFGNQAYEEAFPGVTFIAHRQTRADMVERSIPSLTDYGVEYWTRMAERFEGELAKGTLPDGRPLSEAQTARLRDQARTVRQFLPKLPALRVVLPTIAIDGEATLYLGDREVRLVHDGPGNTAGDLAVYLPGERILATGDLLSHPVPLAYGSDLAPWIATLKALRRLPVDTFVPGHGPVMRDTVYLDLVIEMFESLVAQVAAAAKRGLSLDETRKAVNLQSFRDRMAGNDPFWRGMFADSIVREAVERTYKAVR